MGIGVFENCGGISSLSFFFVCNGQPSEKFIRFGSEKFIRVITVHHKQVLWYTEDKSRRKLWHCLTVVKYWRILGLLDLVCHKLCSARIFRFSLPNDQQCVKTFRLGSLGNILGACFWFLQILASKSHFGGVGGPFFIFFQNLRADWMMPGWSKLLSFCVFLLLLISLHCLNS